jgi:hypothetical protein
MDNQKNKSTSNIRRAARILVYLDSAAWVGFGVAAGFGLISGLPEGPIRWGTAALAAAAGVSMLILDFISRKKEWALYLLMGLLALISLLSLTDQVGLLDWVAYAVNLAALVLLILYLRQRG